MAKGRKRYRDERTADMFAPPAETYPVPAPPVTLPTNISMRLSAMMGEVLKSRPESAPYYADQISKMAGYPCSVAALYACTAPSKPEHDIGAARLIAFVNASGAQWIMAEMAEACGLRVVGEREPLLTQLGALRQQVVSYEQEENDASRKKQEAVRQAEALEEILRKNPVQPRQPYRKRS